MTRLKTISSKLIEDLNKNPKFAKITGINASSYLFFLRENKNFLENNGKKNHLFLFQDQESLEKSFEVAKKFFLDYEILHFSSFEHSPYGGHVASERVLLERFFSLNKMSLNASETKKLFIFTTIEALHSKVPPRSLFNEHQFSIEVSDIISPDQLKNKLQKIGYQNAVTIEEPGTYSHKGEILDIFPINGNPIRLHYFDDMIEEIFEVHKDSLKTNREVSLEKVTIGITPRIFAQPEFTNNLRSAIPMPPVGQKSKFENRKEILSKLSDAFMFEGYPAYVPLFTKSNECLLDYLCEEIRFHIFDEFKCHDQWEHFFNNMVEEHTNGEEDSNSSQILPKPEYLYYKNIFPDNKYETVSVVDFDIASGVDSESPSVQFNPLPLFQFLNINSLKSIDKKTFFTHFFERIKDIFKYSGDIVFFHTTTSGKKEFEHLCEIHECDKDLLHRIKYDSFPIEKSFYYESEKTLFLSESDFFSSKKRKVKERVKQDLDLFAEQISTLSKGDYVIHNDHGIGKYLGMQSLSLQDDHADFLVIEYTNQDKVYVPVYKMNLIQKHANSIANISIDSLRSNKFATLKKRASQSIKKLAFDLLKLQAERQTSQAFSFSPPDHYFREFELAFQFQETRDQKLAIDRVLEDMQKPQPMDHLVCGDVGFGKTEVAIRAAFKAVLDKKQVVVLVPTTILALQHYNSFKKRFNQFPVNLEFLSRFKSPKETNKILESLKNGDVDIIIGTHKLLSDRVKFRDLGLVIVDEEQRFGVNHKEKLKVLKANVDFLTLTATPIPRTLQLSFLGLRDLSLIKTPPPKRQSIKTYIIKEDALTIQSAIKKELNRGGQVFIVHNKVHDIEEYAQSIQELVPEAKITIGHGKLNEKELESRMKGFYEGKYQILLATTIIESGIDIPNANTLIIDRADTYGLSQLHQLRGRIGRSDKKAYAYFVIPSDRSLSGIAEKRLKALQSFAEMGSGFNIASCDLEIRGAGDILGAKQSGEIEAIGLELYMELLQDAIRELKGEKEVFNKNIEITSPFPSYIPNFYIEDSSERLKQYKRLSNCTDYQQIIEILDELTDIYGPTPLEVQNLTILLKARIIFAKCGLKSIQVNNQSISLQFDKSILDKQQELAGNVVKTFINKPNLYHFSPDYKVLYKSKSQLNQDAFIEFCQKIAEQIVPC